MGQWIDQLPLHQVCGLRPQVWLSVGSGFSREDIKSLVLSKGVGFVADAMINPQELCLKILDIPSDRVLASPARQEVLSLILAEKRVMALLPEMKKLRRQKNFVRRLDMAIQAGRMTFAHGIEEEVYSERLVQTRGVTDLRRELQVFANAYEVWMESSSWWDLPLLIRNATQRLREKGWPEWIRMPSEIWVCSIQTPESLEREFWEVLNSVLPVKQALPTDLSGVDASVSNVEWQKWHTLDDAAEYLADQFLMSTDPAFFEETAVLIPDIPGIRRSVKRAFEMRGIPLAEPRDPTQLKWDESVKWGLSPLQVVGRNFERQKVIAWLRSVNVSTVKSNSVNANANEFANWVTEINFRGIRSGLRFYAGGTLEEVHSKLLGLNQTLGGRKTCAEVSEVHIQLLREYSKDDPKKIKLITFFERVWSSLTVDMQRVSQLEKKAPLRFWLEKLEKRLGEASPPIEPLKPKFGVRMYRLQQAPGVRAKKIWIFGIPSRWLSGEGSGDFCFTERDREILSSEFAVRSWVQVRNERLKIFRLWLMEAEDCIVLDADYDSGGRERESLFAFFKELGSELVLDLPDSPQLMGAHPRSRPSYDSFRTSQPSEVLLPVLQRSLSGKAIELSATLLDRYSRCGFQALTFHRWKLRDIREPDIELWPDVRGILLHESVRILMSEVEPREGIFRVLPREALAKAWKAKRPRGLMRSPRVENYVLSRMEKVLEIFCEKEREYLRRSGSSPMSLDEMTLRLEYPDFTIVGQPDRVDRHENGIFIMDYKSSGSVPHGSEMIEHGYRLQLPFYAIAAQKQLKQEVTGVQFIELDTKGGRKSGIMFKEFNGKEPGKLTQLRSNSKSLISVSRADVWFQLEESLIQAAKGYVAGRFNALPRVKPESKECNACRLGDLCGFRRSASHV